MADIDPLARSHENEQDLPRHIQFEDGRSAFVFERPDGEVLAWDAHKYVGNPAKRQGLAKMIVLTESGNQYVLGHGMIIDSRSDRAYVVPEGSEGQVPPLTFGESWNIIGVFQSTPVRAVMAEDNKVRFDGSMQSAKGESPFVAANTMLRRKIIKAISEGKMPDDMESVTDQLYEYEIEYRRRRR